MEFSSLWYFSFWSAISQIFITIGLNFLHKAVDETIFFWSKFFIIYSVCFSCSYAFLFRPLLEQALFLIMNVQDFLIELVLRYLLTLLPISAIGILVMFGPTYSIIVYFTCLLVSFLPLSLILLSVNSRFRFVLKGLVSPFILYPSHTLCWVFFNFLVCVAPLSLTYFDYKTNEIALTINLDFLLTIVKMFCGCSIVAVVVVSTYICGLTWFRKKLVSSPMLSYIHSKIKFVEIVLGIVAYIMVQYIIREKSFFLMLALLSFTVAWVGVVAIVQPQTDFGVFTFLVGASVDCAMSIFGLSRPTWIVCGVCTPLVIFYRKLDSVLLLHSGVWGGILRDWTCLELHKHLQLLVGVTDTPIPRGNEAAEDIWHIQMSPTTCLKIMKGDISTWFVDGATDAIVNPANEKMLGGGGCDGAIHAAAGEELLAKCYQFPQVRPGVRCPTGEARITRGYELPVAHVIHTVGPIYYVERDPEVLLRSAYKNTLNIAKANNIKYIAFPAISCGLHGIHKQLERNMDASSSTLAKECIELSRLQQLLHLQNNFLPSVLEFDAGLHNINGLDLSRASAIVLTLAMFQYPIDRAAEVALSTIKEHANELKEVHFVLFFEGIYNIWLEMALKLLNPQASLTIDAQH